MTGRDEILCVRVRSIARQGRAWRIRSGINSIGASFLARVQLHLSWCPFPRGLPSSAAVYHGSPAPPTPQLLSFRVVGIISRQEDKNRGGVCRSPHPAGSGNARRQRHRLCGVYRPSARRAARPLRRLLHDGALSTGHEATGLTVADYPGTAISDGTRRVERLPFAADDGILRLAHLPGSPLPALRWCRSDGGFVASNVPCKKRDFFQLSSSRVMATPRRSRPSG